MNQPSQPSQPQPRHAPRPLRRIPSQAVGIAASLFLACLALGAPSPATAESCGLTDPCSSAHDYCSAPLFGTCLPRGTSRQSCTGVGQGTCRSGLVCDFASGECRSDPPRLGEICSAVLPCHGAYTCSAAVGGRCEARGDSGDACSGLGQGSCRSGLVCDVIGECRSDPPQKGEPCGEFVTCAAIDRDTLEPLTCSALIGGRCEARGDSGDTCIGVGQGSCRLGLVCDVSGECRHPTPEAGEPCGAGVECADDLACSAVVGGVCEARDGRGETCIGVGQGSCEDGLVCDVRGECRSPVPEEGEYCGIGVACEEGLYCQAGSGRCRAYRTAGEGCSAVNPCGDLLSCEPCLVDGCDHPLQCFPNANQGAITEAQCLAMYSPEMHATAVDLGLSMTYAAGNGIGGVISESQEFGVAYDGVNDLYGCFTSLCVGLEADVEIAAHVSVGFYDEYDHIGGSSTAIVQEAEIAGVANFSTSQVFSRLPDDLLGEFIGTSDAVSIGFSPVPFPISVGTYLCETVLDTVLGGESQAAASICGDGVLAPTEACDDGNGTDGDGCSSACTLEATCGNGVLDSFERCDDWNFVDGDGCSSVCTLEAVCGNGILDRGEACDDGGTTDGDGCSATCSIEPVCGNGVVEPTEACDDGNGMDGDGCSSACEDETAPRVVYDNSDAYIGYWQSSYETGNQITLDGDQRWIEEFEIVYRGPSFSADGDETVRLRFYELDGPDGAPGTLFYDSGPVPIAPGFDVALPFTDIGVEAPETFVWTTLFEGISFEGSDRVGSLAYGPPAVGSAQGIWQRHPIVGPWGHRPEGAAFYGIAVAAPEPGMLLSLTSGCVGLILLERRRARRRGRGDRAASDAAGVS